MRTLPTVRNLTSRQGGDLTPTVAVPPSLQRACACGGSAGLTGECEDCKTKKLLGQQIQPKLTIGSPNDEYEQEADRVADQVMRMPEDGSQFEGIDQPDIASKRVARTPILQREGEGESPPPAEPAKPKEEESSCPSWRADPDSISKRAAEFYARNHMTPTSQATVERINCEAPIANGNYGCYVHFSDGLVLRVIVRQTDIVVGTGPGPITTEHPPAATPLCFYDYSCPEGELVLTVKRCQSAKPSRSVGPPAVAQRKPDSAGTHPAIAPPAVHDVLTAPGQPLDRATRAYFEPRFGYDFGKVRIHADAAASDSARSVDALAYTVGSDIVFRTGRFDPQSAAGRRLLAHELTHVIQQNGRPANRIQRHKDDLVGYTGGQRGRVVVLNAGNPTFVAPAVSGHPGHGENEPSVGPIPTGTYAIQPRVTRPTVSKIQDGVCGASGIGSGYQEITSTDPSPCSGAHYCNVPCPTADNTAQQCYTPRDCWGPMRIKIQGSKAVTTPEGVRKTRDGFYLHGGNPQDAVSSGCVKTLDNGVFAEIRKLTGVKGTVPFCVGTACPKDLAGKGTLYQVSQAVGRAVAMGRGLIPL